MDFKYSYIFLVCVFCFQGSIVCIDGGGENFHMLRNPFFGFETGDTLFVEILTPVDGETYYTVSAATQNISVNTTGDTCQFRINSGGWNDLDLSGDMTSFPEGDVTLTVKCQLGTSSGSDTITFHVEYLLGIYGGTFNGLVLLGFIVIMCIWIMFDDENRKFFKQRF